MKQQTNVHIATPCHEDWNAMTPGKDGKFCTACSKQVVDFTLMSDTQILQFLSKHSTNLCGRFDAGQLERPLREPAVSKKKSWYLALMLPFSLLLQKSFGQKGERKMGKPVVKMEQKAVEAEPVVMGMLMAPPVSKLTTIRGILVNEDGEPVADASVLMKNTKYTCITNKEGKFLLRLNKTTDSLLLTAYAVGYKTLERKMSAKETDTGLVLTLARTENTLKAVVVTSTPTSGCTVRLGGIGTYRTVTHAEKRDSIFKKILRLNPFTVYPNPVRSGGSVQIGFKKAGTYELQLLNGASVLMRSETIQVGSDGSVVSFQIPKQMAAGICYLRLMSGDKKYSYLEKILVNK